MPRLWSARSAFTIVVCSVLLAPALAAHGGMYRGPGPATGGPFTGGGLVPLGPSGPNTGPASAYAATTNSLSALLQSERLRFPAICHWRRAKRVEPSGLLLSVA